MTETSLLPISISTALETCRVSLAAFLMISIFLGNDYMASVKGNGPVKVLGNNDEAKHESVGLIDSYARAPDKDGWLEKYNAH